MKKEVSFNYSHPGHKLLEKVSFSLWLMIVFVLLAMFFLFLGNNDYKQSAFEAVSVTTQIWLPASAYSGILFILALCGKIAIVYIVVLMVEATREGVFSGIFKKK